MIKNFEEIQIGFIEESGSARMFQNWYDVNDTLKKFANNCTQKTFIKIYGESEGERLARSYVERCDRRIDKLMTFLTREQQTVLIYNAYHNQIELYV